MNPESAVLDIATLKDSARFLNELYHQLPFAIFLADETLRLHHFNDPFSTLFGGSSADLLGQLCGNAIGCVFHIDEKLDCGDTSHCAACPLRLTVKRAFVGNGTVFRTVLEREFQTGASRVSKHFLVKVKQVSYEGRMYALVLMDDVTESVETQRSLERRTDELENNNRLLQEALETATGELLARSREVPMVSSSWQELSREVRHRLGNFLQVIDSLLRMTGPETARLSNASRIAFVIEAYRHAHFESGSAIVDTRRMFDAIFASEARTAGVYPVIRYSLQADFISLDASVILSLVAGELFSLGFRNSPHGSMDVSASTSGDGALVLEVLIDDLAIPEAELENDFRFPRTLASTIGGSFSTEHVGRRLCIVLRIPA